MGKRILLVACLVVFLWKCPAHAAFPTPTDLTTSASTTDASSYTTASITPPSNTLILAMISSEAGSAPNVPTLSGNSLTWVQIATDVNGNNRGTLFRARGTATSGTVTIDYGGQTITDCSWTFISVDGAATTGTNGSGAIIQSATTNFSAQTSGTVTLSAFANAANATFGGFAINNNVTITAGSGFTIVNQPGISSSRAAIEWKTANDTSVDATWTSSTGAAVAVEIAPAAASVTGGRKAPLFVD